MRIGMVCYASVGGSGVVATELAHALAARGHRVHLISSEPPFRLRRDRPEVFFEPVAVPSYPLFREPQYLLALATTVARVAEEQQLDVVHAHYAVPHATAAYLADQMLAAGGVRRPCTMTTLHGTDITLVGSDPSYTRVVAFSIAQSHGVTAVSQSLRADTIAALGIEREIRVIPNFLDCDRYRRERHPSLRERIAPASDYDSVVMHMSNFRPVKRIDVALDVFIRIRKQVRARFLLIGDGPVRPEIEAQAREAGVLEHVVFAGEQQDPVPWLSIADLFVLPSAQESFGLAALEAMACEVPVVASNAGGLPEIIADGETGFTVPVGDADTMAAQAIGLLRDRARREAMASAAAAMVRERYCEGRIVPLYEAAYRAAVQAARAPA